MSEPRAARCPVCRGPAVDAGEKGKLYTWVDCLACGGPFPLSYMARLHLDGWAADDPRRAQVSANLRAIGIPWPEEVVFDTDLLGTLTDSPSELVAAHFGQRKGTR